MMKNLIEIKELFDSLYLCEKQLTAGQMQFIEGCKKYFKKNNCLSDKQSEALREIRKYIPEDPVRYSESPIYPTMQHYK